jgi:hypothetical protein
MHTKLASSILKKILTVAACGFACSWAVAPVLAQRAPISGGPRVGGGVRPGGVRVNVPPPVNAAISRPGIYARPQPAGLGPRNFGFQPRPIHFFHPRLFFGRRLFRFGVAFSPAWWPSCGASWTWGWGVDCYPSPIYTYAFQSSVIPQLYEIPVYVYGREEPDQVWLYLKDGSVYGVSDYWFANGQLHFTMFDQSKPGAVEHVIPPDQLDVQKTSYVNTRRGFRMVIRDEPWQQYLKDHPDIVPPELLPPERNE